MSLGAWTADSIDAVEASPAPGAWAVRQAGFRLTLGEPLDDGFALTQFVHPKDTGGVLVELGQARRRRVENEFMADPPSAASLSAPQGLRSRWAELPVQPSLNENTRAALSWRNIRRASGSRPSASSWARHSAGWIIGKLLPKSTFLRPCPRR